MPFPQGSISPGTAEGSILAFLQRPAEAIDLSGLRERFSARRITVQIDGLADQVTDLGLPGRLRGALGEELLRGASAMAAAGQPCPWRPPCAFDALFRKQGRMTPGIDFPNPWVISLSPRRDALYVRLTLFGAACEWAAAASEAFVAVISERIDWGDGRPRGRAGPHIAGRRIDWIRPHDRQIETRVALDMRSPLVVTSRSAAQAPAAAFAAFGLRLEGLARWHGCTLAPVDWRRVAEAVARTCFDWEEAENVAWRRGSRRQDRWIAMHGTLGRLHVSADRGLDRDVADLVCFGELAHIGADIAFGCGCYEIVQTE